jgi:hypothetical protein
VNPRAWFEARRGISGATLDAFGVRVDDEGVIAFPYPGGASKFRKGLEKDDDRRFWWDPPTQAGQVPFLPPDHAPRSTAVLLEGETDTMAAWQALPAELRDSVMVVGLSGTNAWKDRYAEELFGEARRVFVVLDNDDPYEAEKAAKATDAAWEKIQDGLGRKARRVVLPQGINDVAEFFQRYDWAAFQTLLDAAAQPFTHYPRLDFRQPIPETDWLVEDLIEMGSVTVVAGDSGSGKSFLTMGLATALARGDATFLGRALKQTPGGILYVDEENPRDIVLQRFAALGLQDAHFDVMEYISEAGVDLWNEADLLIREAIDRDLRLIVVDSQGATSLGSDENSNREMAMLYRRGFVKLARLTGAAVIVLHHTPKDSAGIPRGAGAIKSNADQVLSIVPQAVTNGLDDVTRFNVYASKQRRLMESLDVEIVGRVGVGPVVVQLQEEFL